MSEEPPIPLDPNFRIHLPNFEGPLDLLLYLIQKHELVIEDLPMAFVTARYVEYIGTMQRLAGEYLVMAATLTHIKSKSLLPDPPKDPDDPSAEELDPRGELIRRLFEYQKFKNAAEQLGGRGVAGRDVFPRGVVAAEASGTLAGATADLALQLRIAKPGGGAIALPTVPARLDAATLNASESRRSWTSSTCGSVSHLISSSRASRPRTTWS